ncbi:hypothetical protein Q8F55_007194 [Vanrija albida]|uniref:Methyltransferase domain-containing protein n=1 Tax=Vanrija albida TaxID=181172 RepID=A0ABR3PZ27_9TREE
MTREYSGNSGNSDHGSDGGRADAHGGGYERQRDDDDGFHRGHQQDRHPRQHSAHPEDHRGQEHSPQRDERRGHQHSPHREPRGHQHQPHHEERHRGVPRRVDAEALAPEGALHALLRGATSEPYTRRADPRLELARVLRAAPRPRVLDIACGRGDWVADVASAFPHIDVPGIRSVHAPPNSRFMSAELDTLIVEGRRLADGAFDVVHLRFAHAKVRDFPTLLHRAYRLLAPGGLLLLLDSAFVPAYPAPREESTHAVPSGIEAHCRALARSLAAAGAHPFPPAAAGALLDELPDVAGGFEADYDVALCAAHRRALLARVAANRHYLRWGGYSGAEVHVLEEAYAAALSRPGLSVRYTALGVRKCLRGEEPKAVWGPRVQAAVAERERERERERAAERARRGGADEQRRRLGRQATAAAGAASGSRSIAALLN